MWIASLPLWVLAFCFAAASVRKASDASKTQSASDAAGFVVGMLLAAICLVLAVYVGRL